MQWRYMLKDVRRKIWFRAALISALSVILALGGAVLAPLIPYDWSVKVGGNAVDTVLSILASSMLAVTTFSLTAMVAAFSGASQQVTPRAVQLLIRDRTAQNALSTFLGGFVFSLVSIVALTTGMYGEQGRVILFGGTIVVAIVIVLTLLRWIGRLVNFGRVHDAIELVEENSRKALASFPGALLRTGRAIPSEAGFPVHDKRTGFLAHVDRETLGEFAREAGVTVQMAVGPGDFIDPVVPVAHVSRELSAEENKALAAALAITRDRDFDQDPRYGMQIFAEIAIRALSPAINDPGTAIQVLTCAQRVLDGFAEQDTAPENRLEGLADMPLSFEEMVETLVIPIARDSAVMAEVGVRLQAMLGSLAAQIPDARDFLKRLASDALQRNRGAKLAPSDLDAVETAHRRAFEFRIKCDQPLAR